MPKSVSLTTPSSRTITFSGFRSRWTTPAACACSSASAMGSRQAAASSGGSKGWASAKARRVWPRMNSVTR